MRKHNKAMAARWGRGKDRTSTPQECGHKLAHNKGFQLAANGLLQRLLSPFIPKREPLSHQLQLDGVPA